MKKRKIINFMAEIIVAIFIIVVAKINIDKSGVNYFTLDVIQFCIGWGWLLLNIFNLLVKCINSLKK